MASDHHWLPVCSSWNPPNPPRDRTDDTLKHYQREFEVWISNISSLKVNPEKNKRSSISFTIRKHVDSMLLQAVQLYFTFKAKVNFNHNFQTKRNEIKGMFVFEQNLVFIVRFHLCSFAILSFSHFQLITFEPEIFMNGIPCLWIVLSSNDGSHWKKAIESLNEIHFMLRMKIFCLFSIDILISL